MQTNTENVEQNIQNIIEVKNFTKSYDKFTAVDNISFNVKAGSIFAFLGPNGAGKSTTINTLCTIFEKTSGNLKISGYDVDKERDKVRSQIGVVFQESTLDPKMTVEENLEMHCVFYNVSKNKRDEQITFVLNLVDLSDWRKKLVGQLSGGMKRRVEIARGLVHYPKVLFLDEPTTGLDPQTRSQIWKYVIKLQKEKNITIFLTTHYMEEAEVCEKIAIMDHGKIVAHDTPYMLKKQYTKDRAYISTNNSHKLKEELQKYNMKYEEKEKYHRIDITNNEDLLTVLANCKEDITDIEIKKGTLNDVFLNITGREIREVTK